MTTSSRRNRLAASTSPYLLQHASNPVDWWPWCDEAFEQARRRNVPVFLSIGYSACHWCHVMERESFEDQATARLMNERFVCVKLDREERPDLDELYMTATVLMTGHGGWPMSVFLEPVSRRPYFCGTYFPPVARGTTPSFQIVLRSMADAFEGQRAEVDEQAQNLAEAVREHLGAIAPGAALDIATVERCTQRVLAMHDAVHGGFGLSPKFPQPALCEFLLDVLPLADATTAAAIDRALRSTLDAMALGGLHDQLAGGFHRYCVDAAWTVPHFEKMLVDQAQLLALYARAGAELGDPFYADVARKTAAFVRSELADPRGGFFTAIDADSEGKEGAAFVWTPEQVRGAIGDPADAAFAIESFGLNGEPNFRDPHHPQAPPAWVLRLRTRPQDPQRLARCAAQLLAARSRRCQPATDDKALASWSGSMFAALSRANLQAQGTGVDQLLLRLAPEGRLHRVARGEAVHTPALLEDYAAIISACCAAGKIGDARRLCETVRAEFTDAATGALFDTPAGATDLFMRACATHDGANPSAFSAMLHALLDLADATGEEPFARDAARALAAQSGRIAASPVGCVHSVRALLRLLRRYPMVAQALASGERTSDADPSPHTPTDADPVRVYASLDRLTISNDTPALITLRVEIQPGYAVASADPGEFGVPFRVDVVGGTGIAAYADYPPSERVYTESFDLPVVIERNGPWTGTPLLSVRWQACKNHEPYACLPPRTVELDIALDRG